MKRKNLLLWFNKNTFLFVGGLIGVAHETILTHAERPTLLILFAAMMGLPAFLTPSQEMRGSAREENREAEDKKNKKDGENEDKHEQK